MIREEVFHRVADVFGTSIGVAHIISNKRLSESKHEFDTQLDYKNYSDELKINEIVTEAVEMGLYQKLQRNLYTINQKGDKRLKEYTIYKKAWKDTINGK
jgi:hypothetical protein